MATTFEGGKRLAEGIDTFEFSAAEVVVATAVHPRRVGDVGVRWALVGYAECP